MVIYKIISGCISVDPNCSSCLKSKISAHWPYMVVGALLTKRLSHCWNVLPCLWASDGYPDAKCGVAGEN